MMRSKVVLLAATLWLLCHVGLSLAGDVAGGEAAAKELEKFQGDWVMVSGEMDGKKVSDEHMTQSKVSYEGNKIEIVVPNQTSETIIADIVKIDPTKSPRTMHFVRRNGPNAGKTLTAIYEFQRDGQYRFAFDPTGKMTLEEFVTKEGTGHVRNTWKRVKP